jgi:hypothetical protein
MVVICGIARLTRCNKEVKVVLMWSYGGVTVVQQLCYSGVTVMLQWCHSGVVVVLQWCHNRETKV